MGRKFERFERAAKRGRMKQISKVLVNERTLGNKNGLQVPWGHHLGPGHLGSLPNFAHVSLAQHSRCPVVAEAPEQSRTPFLCPPVDIQGSGLFTKPEYGRRLQTIEAGHHLASCPSDKLAALFDEETCSCCDNPPHCLYTRA
jgi:hypothetical protein